MKIIIIGGVVGGVIIVVCIRCLDEIVEIILLEKGKYIFYVNCGLFYYIGDVIEECEKLFVQIFEVFGVCFRVDVCIENEVIFIDWKKKIVIVCFKSEDIYEESYDKLLIFIGVFFVCLLLLGIDLIGIFILWNVVDIDCIKVYVNNWFFCWVVVIGVGFIGLEMVENLYVLGV